MPRYFTHYWANETAEEAQALGEDKLEWVASNGFVWRGVSVGDVVYPVTVVDGVLRLLGSLEVGRVCDLEAAREELGYDPWWEASDYLLATVPLPTRFDLEVPTETTRSLRFVSEGRSQPPVFVESGRLDRQTMRGIRELTPASAAALETLLRPAGPRPLSPYEDYSREEVYDIFAPDTAFTTQRGAWGMHGIVAIPGRPGDYVFFVTLGQRQGEHAFDEGITENGVLAWQSQPRQGLHDRHVRRFIEHDELRNSIYLFYRPRMRGDYTYLGRLKYLSHDAEREHPVYFQWQILDWDPPEDVLRRTGIVLQPPAEPDGERATPVEGRELRQTPPPTRAKREGTSTPSFRGRKKIDYSDTDFKNRELGMAGELLVIQHERRVLTEGGRSDLARRVRHASVVEGDGAGYDVGSFTLGGEPKYIEVKTTRGSAETPFFVTANEVAFSEAHPDQYFLYRVYHYDDDRDAGTYYSEAGSISSRFELAPMQFRATPRSEREKD